MLTYTHKQMEVRLLIKKFKWPWFKHAPSSKNKSIHSEAQPKCCTLLSTHKCSSLVCSGLWDQILLRDSRYVSDHDLQLLLINPVELIGELDNSFRLYDTSTVNTVGNSDGVLIVLFTAGGSLAVFGNYEISSPLDFKPHWPFYVSISWGSPR